MRSKIIKLSIAVVAISALTWYALKLLNTSGKSDTELIEFAIKDIPSINKVIITDQWDRKLELIKSEDGTWSDKEGHCLMKENIDYVLDAIRNIEFKGYVPEDSKERYIELMSAQHTKVEIFQNGKWSKTWYIGPSTQDHYGQIMLLDDKAYGKSDNPVIMHIKGVNGIVEPRFKGDYREWMCRDILTINPQDITEVDVNFVEEPQRSFKVTQKGANLNVYQGGKRLPNIDTSMIFRYLVKYKDVNFNMPNYTLNKMQIDSVKRSKPFCILSVSERNNQKTVLRMFRIQSRTNEMVADSIMEVEDPNANLFWCEIPNGDLVKCQYFHFNQILMGHVYFPSMNLEGIKTYDGLEPIKKDN